MPRRTQNQTPEPEQTPEVTSPEIAEVTGQNTPDQDTPEQAEPAIPAMKIDVRITSTRNHYGDPTRALATVTLNDAFVIKGFRVVKGENGLFCSMPARRLRNGEFSEICNPITADFSRQLSASVLGEYQVHLAQQMSESQEVPHVIDPVQEQEPQGYEGPEPEMQ